MRLADIRTGIFLFVITGYLVFDYGFMQLRVPPGIPLGDIGLIVCLATINIPVVLKVMGRSVNLIPFMIWWGYGLARALLDSREYGEWALRDAAQVFESLYLIVGFAVAQKSENVETLFRWLKWLFLGYCVYVLGVPFQDTIAKIGPTVSQASTGEPVPIFGAYGAVPPMLLWIAFYLIITRHDNRFLQAAATPIACMMIGVTVIVGQARTIYIQLFALLCLLGLFRRKSLGKFAMAIPLLFILIGIITAFQIKIPGRISDEVSFSFIIDHFAAMGGMQEGNDEGVTGAASGVPQRIGWFTKILREEWADPVVLITGLGYGQPLTDFVYQNGATVREPHNSFMSVLGRLGLVGAVSWIWLQVELFRRWRRAFAYYRSVGAQLWCDRLLLLLAFVVLVLANAIGEDALEKPYFIIPYYCFWGVLLRLGESAAAARQPVVLQGGYSIGRRALAARDVSAR